MESEQPKMTEPRYVHEGTSLLFPTPLLSYQIADAEQLNALLLEEIALRRKINPGAVRSNRGGWASVADFFDRTEPGHRALAAAIRDVAIDATEQLGNNPVGLPKATYRFQGWVNVNPRYAYNAPHDHPGAFWAGAYYVANARAAPDDETGGAISFVDPRCAPAGQSLVKAPMFKGSHTLQPTPGTLLLFPSNAKHWVQPNSAETDRVTVAFNVFVAKRRQARPGAAL
jgi:uncharacterized protein (TIGR02466 family)